MYQSPPSKGVTCIFRNTFELLKWVSETDNRFTFVAIYQRCTRVQFSKLRVAGLHRVGRSRIPLRQPPLHTSV